MRRYIVDLRRVRVLAHLALTLLLFPPHPVAASAVSDDDARLLRHGAIVFKTDLPPGPPVGRGVGGTAVALVQADTEAVWQTLLDFPGHAGLFPGINESAVIERQPNRALVRYRVAVGVFSFRFFIKNYIDTSEHTLRWELDHERDNGLFRDHWGYWKVQPWDDGTLVTYAMGWRASLPAFLVRGAGRDGALLAVRALKTRVEQPAL